MNTAVQLETNLTLLGSTSARSFTTLERHICVNDACLRMYVLLQGQQALRIVCRKASQTPSWHCGRQGSRCGCWQVTSQRQLSTLAMPAGYWKRKTWWLTWAAKTRWGGCWLSHSALVVWLKICYFVQEITNIKVTMLNFHLFIFILMSSYYLAGANIALAWVNIITDWLQALSSCFQNTFESCVNDGI